MKCLTCFDGIPQVGVTQLTYTREGSTMQISVEGIPAEICPVCGEVYLSEAVAQQIHNLVSPLLTVGEEMQESVGLPVPTVMIKFPQLATAQLEQAVAAD